MPTTKRAREEIPLARFVWTVAVRLPHNERHKRHEGADRDGDAIVRRDGVNHARRHRDTGRVAPGVRVEQ